MAVQLSIIPAGDYDANLPRLLERAHTEPFVVASVSPSGEAHRLIFCGTREMEDYEREYLATQGEPSPFGAVVEIDSHGLLVSLQAAPAARAQAEDFLRWVLRALGPCRVVDHETGEELPPDPQLLFAPDVSTSPDG